MFDNLTSKARAVILALDGEYRSAGSITGISRQAIAAVGSRHSDLVEREWQDGYAQCLYYRLTPLGLRMQTALRTTPEIGREG